MTDRIEYRNNASVHHGKFSDRAYLTEIKPEFTASDLYNIEKLAQNSGYSKIIAKVKNRHIGIFEDSSYRAEAFFPLKTGKKISFMTKYLKAERMAVKNGTIISDVLKVAERAETKEQSTDMQMRRLTADDCEILAELYRQVFETYPFPIHSAEYLRETMQTNMRYYGIFSGKSLIAAASAETDSEMTCAEMSDFATLEEYRRLGLAGALNLELEKNLFLDGVKCYYTIARSVSYGMNKTFAGCGYTFTGTLFNNTNIGGGIESMNVWYKHA
jgi:putative beta-lysine N-acetyltransferase